MKMFDVYPVNDINIVKAKGSFVWDDNGIQYLDMYGGHAVISIGHTHPYWVDAIQKQLNEVAFYSNSVRIPVQQQLADKLAAISGKPDYQLFLVNSGAEANENALKLASFHTGRKKIVAFDRSFHGRTSLAVAVTDNPSIIAPVNETDNITFLSYNDEDALKSFFEQNGDEVAAVIIEAIQGVGGIRVATDGFLQLIRSLCDSHGSVFIADEVQCGYGRTGKFFACDHAAVNADIYSMAKGMGNGFPVGAIMISPKIPARHLLLGTTFGGNHLACVAALAVLEVIEKERLMNNADATGWFLTGELKKISGLSAVRGKGLMIGFDVADQFSALRKNLLTEHKIFTGEAKPNVVRLLPALNLSVQEAEQCIDSIRIVMRQLSKEQEPKSALPRGIGGAISIDTPSETKHILH